MSTQVDEHLRAIERESPRASTGAWIYILRIAEDPAYIKDVFSTWDEAKAAKNYEDEIVMYQVAGTPSCENGCTPTCRCQGSCHCHRPSPNVALLT